MADTSVKTSGAKEAEKSSVPENTPRTDKQSKKAFLSGAVTFLLLLAVIGLACFYWEQKSRLDDFLSEQAEQLGNVNALTSRLETLQQQLNQSENSFASSEILINQQNARLDNLSQELAALRLGVNSTGGNDRLLQLNEAASLLRLAQLYLLEGQELMIARSLYQRSQNLLSQVEDPAVNRISELLRSDLLALNSTQPVDVSGLFLRLSELSDELSTVRMGPDIEPSDAFLNGEDAAESPTQGYLAGISNFFRRYFTLRKLDEPPRLPLNAEQIGLLRQIMLLQIEQAKLGLLQGKSEIYLDSISEVFRLSEQNIADSIPLKANILRSLQQLQSENIRLELPSLSNAPGLLESLLVSADFDQQRGP